MKVLVCVKQTFDTEAKIELKDGKIADAGINLIINPYDEVVEGAIQLKEKGIAKEIVIVAAGSDKAMDAIRTALAMGADREYWCSRIPLLMSLPELLPWLRLSKQRTRTLFSPAMLRLMMVHPRFHPRS